MAAPSNLSPQMLQVIGSYLPMAVGVATLSGTTVTVTIPQFTNVLLAIASAAGSTATAPRCDSYSGNTFTITGASGEQVTWIAFGQAKL